LPAAQRRGDGVGGLLDERQIGLEVLAQRRGHADDHRVGVAELHRVRSRLEARIFGHLLNEVFAEVF
jgi:hypothetical protein